MRNPEEVFQCGIPEGMPSWSKRNGEVKACHAGKPVLKVGIQGDHYGNRKPHTCKVGDFFEIGVG